MYTNFFHSYGAKCLRRQQGKRKLSGFKVLPEVHRFEHFHFLCHFDAASLEFVDICTKTSEWRTINQNMSTKRHVYVTSRHYMWTTYERWTYIDRFLRSLSQYLEAKQNSFVIVTLTCDVLLPRPEEARLRPAVPWWWEVAPRHLPLLLLQIKSQFKTTARI